MSHLRTTVLMLVLLGGVGWLSSCGDGTTESPLTSSEPPRATTLTVTPATTELTALGATVQLTAEVRDQNGNVMAGATVTWSSSATAVAVVNAAGLVTAAGDGTATITATAGSASGAATVTVAQRVSTVTVTPTADTLVIGDTLRLTADAADANGHPVASAEISWVSGDTSVAVVDATGLVTGVSAGEVDVTATASEITGRAAIAVVAPEPTSIAVTPDTVAFTALGQTAQLAAQVLDQIGRAMTDFGVSWSSADTTVAAVDTTGLVLAIGGGTSTVTATAREVSGTAVVTVTQSVDSIVVSPAAATVAPGDTLRLLAEAFDENGHAIDGVEFSWSSSNDSVATVDGSGWVRGVAEGSATIMATAGSTAAASEITVDNPDRQALVAFYEGTSGDFYWDDDTNWLSDQPVGTWFGVTTDGAGRVVELAMPDNGVWGAIPPEFGQLQKLKRLDVSNNNVNGELPAEIGSLPDLEVLDLSENDFLGSETMIPAALGNLGKLERLDLSGTSFEGTIPPELGSLKNLVGLDLADMSWLSGSIPAEFGQLVNLGHLDVTGSGLDGALPRELVNVPLDFFHWHRTLLCAPGDEGFRTWLSGIANHRTGVAGACDAEGGVICNSWDGWTLEWLYYLADGEHWDTDTNWLTDQPLDSWHGVAADDDGRVVELSLSDNGLRNAFSGHVLCLRNLKRLDLSGNRLTGVLGSRIGDLLDLEYLDLSDNPLMGYTGGPFLQFGTNHPIPAALGNLGKLEWLDLSGTSFGEAIPRELGSLSSLIRLDLADMDWLSGPIPSEFGQLSQLRHFDVSDSQRMDGALPQELVNVPLDLFHWNDTRLCSPPNQEFDTWLRGIADHQGGSTCGSTSGALRFDALDDSTSLGMVLASGLY